ncbi:MAG TPA: response regulator transcription factor [Ktedonobacteraceae bacterium]|jgi:DNA-binding NarL/FixJ family response regulator
MSMQYPDREHKQYTTVSPVSLTVERGNSISPDQGDDAREGARKVDVISVFLVDDHALIREGLRQLLTLEQDIQIVGDAADGFEAMLKIRQLCPDVVLMDIHMPIVDGIAMTRRITQEFPSVAVIMLTMHCQQQQLLLALKNGAKGYLLKNTSVREVAQAIRTVHSGGTYIEPTWTGMLIGEIRRLSDPSALQQPADQLSDKEIEIIRYVALGMSNREIAEKLAYSEKTVKNYLSTIFQKLRLRDRTQVAIFALRRGLVPDTE